MGCARFENCEKFSTKRRKRRPGEQTPQQPLNALQVVAEIDAETIFLRLPANKRPQRKEKNERGEEKRREKKRKARPLCLHLHLFGKKKKQQHNYWLFFPLVRIYISASESIRCCLNGWLGWLVVSPPPCFPSPPH